MNGAIAALVAVVIPIHAQDALAFGEWSRLISEDWHVRQAAATAQGYGRPLFYVIQGWLWGAFGFSETVGRLLSGLFSGLLGQLGINGDGAAKKRLDGGADVAIPDDQHALVSQ